jgi:hypothetical protein
MVAALLQASYQGRPVAQRVRRGWICSRGPPQVPSSPAPATPSDVNLLSLLKPERYLSRLVRQVISEVVGSQVEEAWARPESFL